VVTDRGKHGGKDLPLFGAMLPEYRLRSGCICLCLVCQQSVPARSIPPSIV